MYKGCNLTLLNEVGCVASDAREMGRMWLGTRSDRILYCATLRCTCTALCNAQDNCAPCGVLCNCIHRRESLAAVASQPMRIAHVGLGRPIEESPRN